MLNFGIFSLIVLRSIESRQRSRLLGNKEPFRKEGFKENLE